MCSGHLITTSWDETIRLWDLKTGHCLLTLRGHTEAVYCCQFDERRIVSGGGDNLVVVWNAKTADIEAKCTGHTGDVYCLAYNESIIASGSSDSTVRLWSFEGELLHTLCEHIGIVRCLHLTNNRLVSGGDRKKIVVWDIKSGKQLNVVHRNPTLLHVMWADETKLITASPEKPGTITIIKYW
ncbi:F-box/WD repeat-containing protein 7 [Exaiptasia diaphana]|nr:F-box/WD repeat-containing protein 7 [Exaiptasia diaphana]